MAHQLFRQASFASGELSNTLYGRTDIPRYDTGVRTLRNMIATKQGPVKNRPGFEYIGAPYDAYHKVRLEAFVFNNSQTYVLEFGHLYIQSWQNGVVVGNRAVTPYTEDTLATLKFAQVGDVLTITHPSFAPATLSRTAGAFGAPTWTMASISFTRASLPSVVSMAFRKIASGEVEGPVDRLYDTAYPFKSWEWALTGVSKSTKKESVIHAKLKTTAATWPGGVMAANYFIGCVRLYGDNAVVVEISVGVFEATVADIEYFNLYRGRDGVYGYVGRCVHLVNVNGTWVDQSTVGILRFMDTALVPILNQVPPTGNNPFLNDNPAVSCFFQGRRFFANLSTDSAKIWGSKTNDYTGFDPPEYPGADDAFYLTLASRYLEEVRWLYPLRTLLVGTNQGVWAIGGAQGSALTAGSVDSRLQLTSGSSWLDPLIITNALLYTMDKSGYVIEAQYTQEQDGYKTMDLSLWSEHLFDGYTVDDWCYQQLPDGIVWAVRSDGALLGLTYMKEQEVWGWHWHDTQGAFESVCSIPESGVDRLYAVVNRAGVRSIERMDTRKHAALKDYIFLDCAKAQTRASSTAVTGLSHLNGRSVYALADGSVQGPFTVSGGAITLDVAAATVIVGLNYSSDFELLDLSAGSAEVRGVYKSVVKVMLEVAEASYFEVGESFTDMVVWTSKTQPNAYDPPYQVSQLAELYIKNTWNRHGRACVRSTKPLPLTIQASIREVAFGG